MTDASVNRRALLGGAAVAGAATLATPAVAQGRTLRVVTSWSADLPILPASASRLAQSVDLLTGGALKIEVVNAGPETYGAFDVFDMVREGRADAYHSVEQYWDDRHPAYAFFSTVPFGLTAEEVIGWLFQAGGNDLWQELASQYGLRPLNVGNTGMQMGGWFAEKINSLQEVAGRRLSMPGIGGKVWQAAGLQTTNLEGADLIPALFDGKVDAVEWFGPHLDLNFGFTKLLPYYMFPGWQEPGEILTLGVNAQVYGSLSDQERYLLDIASRQESFIVTSELLAENGRSLNIMRREYGAQLEAFPEEVLDRLAQLTDQVLEEIAAHDDLSRRIFDSYQSYRQATTRYSQISNGRFVGLRNQALGLNDVYTYR